MTYSFRTNGDYIDFVHTDNTSLLVENVLKSLHNTSRCITWGLPEDTTLISFVIDRISCDNIPIAEIDFDGVAMNSQDDFETAMTSMFPGLAGGSSPSNSYLVAVLGVTQTGTTPLSVGELQNTIGDIFSTGGSGGNVGFYTLTFPANSLAGKNVWVAPFGDWDGDGNVYLPIHDGSDVIGNYVIYPNAPANEIKIECVDAAGVSVNFSTLISSTTLYLPEIRVYP